jgi:hypothetical protein
MDRWVPGGLPVVPVDEARVELVRRWLATFGPGTTKDVAWWTGWTQAVTKRAVAGAGAVEVDLDDGATGWVLADDLEPSAGGAAGDPEPWIALLPSLDPTTMGWQARDWYLGEHRTRLFDTNGNAGPTIWLDGRVVGGWVQRRDGEVAYRLLDDVGRDATALVDARAGALQAWLGDLRFIPASGPRSS